MPPRVRSSNAAEDRSPGYAPYEPQSVAVPVAEGIWTIEGPVVHFRALGISVPCPTRMTVVRLADGGLWLHSPIRRTRGLEAALAVLGRIEHLVAPSTHHHLHVAEWAAPHPDAQVHAVPVLIGKLDRAGVVARSLALPDPPAWADEIDLALLLLPRFEEAAFFHARSGTVVLTDLMQRFEGKRVSHWHKRALLWLGRALGPPGSPSIEVRIAALGRFGQVRALRERMLRWRPARVIMAHGRPCDTNAEAEIERAFRWAG